MMFFIPFVSLQNTNTNTNLLLKLTKKIKKLKNKIKQLGRRCEKQLQISNLKNKKMQRNNKRRRKGRGNRIQNDGIVFVCTETRIWWCVKALVLHLFFIVDGNGNGTKG